MLCIDISERQDFSKLPIKHPQIFWSLMAQSKLFDIERLIKFRRDMHHNPELAFKEVDTSNNIVEYLKSVGVKASDVRRIAKTALVIDIKGQAPPVPLFFLLHLTIIT